MKSKLQLKKNPYPLDNSCKRSSVWQTQNNGNLSRHHYGHVYVIYSKIAAEAAHNFHADRVWELRQAAWALLAQHTWTTLLTEYCNKRNKHRGPKHRVRRATPYDSGRAIRIQVTLQQDPSRDVPCSPTIGRSSKLTVQRERRSCSAVRPMLLPLHLSGGSDNTNRRHFWGDSAFTPQPEHRQGRAPTLARDSL